MFLSCHLLCVLCLSSVLAPPRCPSHASQESPCYLIQAAPHNTLHGTQTPQYCVPISAFVTFISIFFVRLTSVRSSYPKLKPQLKWKSSSSPRGSGAITSYSLRHTCHFCWSLENLMVVLPFSPRFQHKH